MSLLPLAAPAALFLSALLFLTEGALASRKAPSLRKIHLPLFSLLLLLSLVPLLLAAPESLFHGQFLWDSLSRYSGLLLGFSALSAMLLLPGYSRKSEVPGAETAALLFLGNLALLLLSSTTHLLTALLALDAFSFITVLLGGILRDRRSSEGAMKTFFLGLTASLFSLFGLALLFGATGKADIASLVSLSPSPLLKAGLLLFLFSFLFKFAMAPLHSWAPDLYQVAPAPLGAYLSTAPKVGIALFLLRLSPALTPLLPFLGAFVIITVLWGNLCALRQEDLRRLAAYSSVAHSGYMALALLLPSPFRGNALLFYLTVYVIMNLSLFQALSLLPEGPELSPSLENLKGWGKDEPWIAGFLAFALLSLAGFPPTPGFLAKAILFLPALEKGLFLPVGAALLGTLISVAAYFRLFAPIYFSSGSTLKGGDRRGRALLALSSLLLLVLTLWPKGLTLLIKEVFSHV